MIMEKILNMSIIKTVGYVCMALSCSSCHMVSTGTMIYDYKNEQVVDFQPTPLLPGRYREVIIHASPMHSCFFTMQPVYVGESKYSLIRKKDYAGKTQASYMVECGVYPSADHFDISPDCARLFICGARLHDETVFSGWCDLPELLHDDKIQPKNISSILGEKLSIDTHVLQKKNCLFLSSDVMLCILTQNNDDIGEMANAGDAENISTFYLSIINFETNKYNIIKEFRQINDVSSARPITTYDVILKANEDGLAAILIGSKLHLYNYKDNKFEESIAIDELPKEPFPWIYPSFSWISNDTLLFWKKHDDEGHYITYNIHTHEKTTGKIGSSISVCLHSSIVLIFNDIEKKREFKNLSTGEHIRYPSSAGSRIYEVFWLKEGLLGFNCDY